MKNNIVLQFSVAKQFPKANIRPDTWNNLLNDSSPDETKPYKAIKPTTPNSEWLLLLERYKIISKKK